LVGGLVGAPAQGNADTAFLTKLGAEQGNPDIRRVINEENGYIALQNRTVADKLVFWNDENKDADIEKAPAPVVDAKKEKERLKKNKADNKPANTGDVPVIDKKKNTLDKIF
jgi:Protein of unknown function (DUF3035)